MAEVRTRRLGAPVRTRLAIEKLMTGDYPRALDQRKWADYAALFTADADLKLRDSDAEGICDNPEIS